MDFKKLWKIFILKHILLIDTYINSEEEKLDYLMVLKLFRVLRKSSMAIKWINDENPVLLQD